MTKKVKLFTHTDLDGVGCAVVARQAFRDRVDIEYCDYHNVNDKVAAFLDSDEISEYSEIYITDISVDEEIAERIESDYKTSSRYWTLLDHHKTAEWLNIYRWATVNVIDWDGVRSSGTDMIYYNTLLLTDSQELKQFVEAVRSYDTWDWTVNGNVAAKDLNDLLWLIGRDRFFARFSVNPSIELTDTEREMLDIERDKIDRYVRKKSEQVSIHRIQRKMVAAVFAEQYTNDVGAYILKQRQDIDLVAIISPTGSISFRSLSGKADVGQFAKLYGGGGHVTSAGARLSEKSLTTLMSIVFKEAVADNWRDIREEGADIE